MAFVSFEKYALMSLVLADAVEHEPKKRKKGEHVLAWVRPENSSDHRNVLLSPPKINHGTCSCSASSPVCAFASDIPERLVL